MLLTTVLLTALYRARVAMSIAPPINFHILLKSTFERAMAIDRLVPVLEGMLLSLCEKYISVISRLDVVYILYFYTRFVERYIIQNVAIRCRLFQAVETLDVLVLAWLPSCTGTRQSNRGYWS